MIPKPLADLIIDKTWKNKLVSIIASRTSVIFNQEFKKRVEIVFKDVDTDEARLYRTKVGEAFFDGRAFSLSKEEVQNNLYWRQFDASKNSVIGRIENGRWLLKAFKAFITWWWPCIGLSAI